MEQGLKKTLKLPQLIALAAGGMIAAWMVEIQYWFSLTGTGSLLALILCAVFVLPLCFIYAEMTTMLPYAGGENVWVSNAFGWNTGWVCCWFVLLLYVMAMPTVSYGIASMIGYLHPITSGQTKLVAAIILVVWFFLTNKELKFIAKLQSILFWATLIVSLAASVIFICSGSWSFSNFRGNLFPSGGKGFSAAIALLIMKFIGFDLIPQLSEEANFPKKKMWKAFVGSLGFTVLIYAMAVVGVGGIISQDWVLQTDIVDPRVADMIDMHWLGIVIVIMGTGTCLDHIVRILDVRVPYSVWSCKAGTVYEKAGKGKQTWTAVSGKYHRWYFIYLLYGICTGCMGKLYLYDLRINSRSCIFACCTVLPETASFSSGMGTSV